MGIHGGKNHPQKTLFPLVYAQKTVLEHHKNSNNIIQVTPVCVRDREGGDTGAGAKRSAARNPGIARPAAAV